MITPINNNQYHPRFSARCVQIRDADWVCHTINNTFPHFSLTKHLARIRNFIIKNKKFIKYSKEPTNIVDAYNILNITSNIKNEALHKQIKNIIDLIENFGNKRVSAEISNNQIYNTLYSFEKLKIGNCSEHAIIAELILKINGIKNATYAVLCKGDINEKLTHKWKFLDHAICIFNKDGSKFNGKITKHTIIIDPWINKAGFAKEMERYYSNEYPQLFKLEKGETYKYDYMETVLLDNKEMKKIKKQISSVYF